MATTYSGGLIFLYLRQNGTTGAFKSVVCNEDLAISINTEILERSTKCGVLKAAGQSSNEVPFSGVCNFAPGVTELSHNELLDWAIGKVKLDFVMSDAATGGTILDISGSGYIGAFEIQTPAEDFIAFDATFAVDGNVSNNI